MHLSFFLDSDYGETGYDALKHHVARRKNLCLADPISIHRDYFTDRDYEKVIRNLLKNKMTRVVIVFADRVPAGRLLEAAKRLRVKNR